MGHRLSSGHDDTIPASQPPEQAVGDESAQPDARYRLGAELGRGGMGRVVEAFDTQLGRTVAFKEVLPKSPPGAARRFQREVEITARLEHASIVPLYDSGTTADGRPYYVMRKVSGRPLDDLIARAPALDERLALLPNVLSAIDAIAHAHRRGVIHRDLKPANILVGELGETVVIDWGLAKVIGEEDEVEHPGEPRIPAAADSLQTQLGSVFGTPGFMPPEQARGEELGPRSDVFALGATLYTLLVGKPPVIGKSATEMLEATHKHDIAPIAIAAPRAPAELAAIVDKALAHEPVARYRNAGELAEDVRRFLTGQLVAAHRYTKRERVARFAKRHRAVLSVSATGLAVVAVLAWVGVHRIIVERDAASEARAIAQREKDEADRANLELRDHLDDLHVEQAKALVTQNPTRALAALKLVRPSYHRLAAATAVAEEAVARGIAWALPTGAGQMMLNELDPSGTRLLQTTLSGDVRIFDLDARKLALSRTYQRGVRALWVDDGKLVLVYSLGGPAQLVDPRTGAVQPAQLPAIAWALADDRGQHVIYTDAKKAPFVLDVATREARALPLAQAPEIAIASDGSWTAAADGKDLVVWDAAGKELARHAFGAHVILAAGAHRLAALEDRELEELVLAPAPKWTKLAPVEAPQRVLQLAYRGDQLVLLTSSTAFLVHSGDSFARIPGDPGLSWDLTIAGDSAVAIAATGKIFYQSGFAVGELSLPTAVPNARLAGRAGTNRLVVAGDGILVVYDLADVLPRAVPLHHAGSVRFADDDLAIVHDQTADWSWVDLGKGTVTPCDLPAWGDSYLLDVDAERRALVTINAADGNHVGIERPGEKFRDVFHSPRALRPPRAGVLVPGDALAFGDGARVMVATGSEEPHELVKVDGDVVALAPVGHLKVAALSARGELARAAITGSDVERAKVELHDTALLAADREGHALVATGRVLYIWDAQLRELATLDQPIVWFAAVDGGAVVQLADRGVWLVPAGDAPRRVMTVGTQSPAVSRDGKVMVAAVNGGDIEVVELPAGDSWHMQLVYGTPQLGLGVSPRSRRFAHAGRSLLVWALPEPRGSLHDWLGELTDACLVGNALAWPWEGKCQP